MKIGLRGGHSPNCKGAMGYLDEQKEVRKIYYELKPLLEAQGHKVIDCNSDENSSGADLRKGTNTANNNKCDLFISIHMNASNGKGHGDEVILYNHTLDKTASAICKNLSALGLTNRGVKYNTHLHDLRASAMPGMIVETLFCDNKGDSDIYNKVGAKGIATAIVKAFGQVKTAGWQKDTIGWWYKKNDGSYYKTEWAKLDGIWYYFDETGYAIQNRWKWIDNKCYYFNNSCHMMVNTYIPSASQKNYYHWVGSDGVWDEKSDSWDVSRYKHL